MKLKKWLLVGGIATLGLAMVGGFGFAKKQLAYAKQSIQAWADDNTDPEQEIKRLKGEVAQLDGEEGGIKNDLAKEIAAADKLKKDTDKLRAAVEDERVTALAFKDKIKDAEENNKKVSLGKVNMNVDDAKRKLQADTNNYLKRNKMVADMDAALKVREESKAVLYAQLDEIQNLRRSMTADLDSIEAEYKSLKLQGMKGKYTRDNSKLSEVNGGIEKLRERLAEKRALNDLNHGRAATRTEAETLGSTDDIAAPLMGK